MNFEKIFVLQKEYDEAMYKSQNITDLSKLQSKRFVALIVELCEFANEVQFFKYWKKNILINDEKKVEEYIDGICFFVSFAFMLNLEEKIISPIILSEDLNIQFLKTLEAILYLKNNFNKKNYLKAISLYLGIAKILKISDEEIEFIHEKKIKINFLRIKNNY